MSRPNVEAPNGVIRGRVIMPDGKAVTKAVKVTLKIVTGDHTVAYTDQQGLFEFNGLSTGAYTVEAEADREREFETVTERVQVLRNTPVSVTLMLREKTAKPGESSPAGVVSAQELGAKVPAKAAEAFERGSAAARAGKPAEAVAHFEKAVALHPDYLAARNDLGTQLLALGRLEEAGEQLREAARIDPKAFNPRLNLAIVYVGRGRFIEAAEAAELALALNPASPGARLYAGIAHLGLEGFERAETELTTAYRLGGAPFALAQFHLGQLYLNRGERALALKAFETYLRDMPDAANAEQVKRLLGELR
ncbi:MAG TPA: tetratricopeptide repeat protein [Pyrinomonadaceae bacterium]